ncbi:MAG: TldD/PmbA family protein [Cyanobacteria bacterium P01_F01_bin.42]
MDSQTQAQNLLELAKRAGADAAEVYQLQTRSQAAYFDANHLKQIDSRESSGTALRLWQHNCPGLAVTQGVLDPHELVARAITLAQLSPPQLVNLPATRLCSSKLNRGKPASQSQLIEWGYAVIESIHADSVQLACSAEMSCESETIYLANSAGLECGYTDTTLRSFITTEWIRGHDFLCVEANQIRRDSIDRAQLIERTLQGLDWAAERVAAPSGAVPILFTAKASEVIWDTVQTALNGQRAADSVSPWSNYLNKMVLSPQLTLTQHPEVGPFSCPFDDEGMPSHMVELVSSGRLRGFFTDQTYGALLGVNSTGNGFRPHLHSYPAPELINLLVTPGSHSFTELIQKIDDGLIVDQVLGETRRVSGDLSFNVDLGYRVQQGQVQGRVKDTVIRGNVYQALNQLIALGNDNQWNDIYYSPSLLVAGFSVIPRVEIQ